MYCLVSITSAKESPSLAIVSSISSVLVKVWVREAIEKRRLYFGYCPKGRGRGGRVQLEFKSFEVVLFSPSLTFFWTLNGGRGDDQVPKVLRHFLPKYWVNI